MRFSCRKTRAKIWTHAHAHRHIHSKYVIFIAFSQSQRLIGRGILLLYTLHSCLVPLERLNIMYWENHSNWDIEMWYSPSVRVCLSWVFEVSNRSNLKNAPPAPSLSNCILHGSNYFGTFTTKFPIFPLRNPLIVNFVSPNSRRVPNLIFSGTSV